VITILLADDNPDMLAALVQLLQLEFTIVGALTNGDGVLSKADVLRPDVILVDVSLADITGFQVVERLKGRGCQSKVVLLSVHEDPEFVRAASDLGVSGYVFKSQINRDLVNALRAAAKGSRYFSERET
jgi:DNA-binding NarL/FixJ family response regulator